MSILSVISPRGDAKLVTLAAYKSALQITANTDDDYLTGLIDTVSADIENHCRRIFAVETLSETFRLDRQMTLLSLARYPVTELTSITVDGTALVSDEFELDASPGMLHRLSGDSYCVWRAAKIVVAYKAGYAAIPAPAQQACIELVKGLSMARTRDPNLRSENILEGLYSYQRFLPTDAPDGKPLDVLALLKPYVNYVPS